MTDWRLVFLLGLAACSPAEEERNSPVAAPSAQDLPASQARSIAPARVSVFTKLSMETCRILEENEEEGPYWLRRCPGHAKWQLDWSDSDLRQGLTLVSPDGREAELSLSDQVANGAFNSLGETIEWRGDSAANPDALIARMNVANGVEPRLPDISRLVVVRLGKSPCLIAVVEPGPNQNQRARDIADGPVTKCVEE